jgi:hypothetical protein
MFHVGEFAMRSKKEKGRKKESGGWGRVPGKGGVGGASGQRAAQAASLVLIVNCISAPFFKFFVLVVSREGVKQKH